MDNTEVKQLIESFKQYRDLLVPVQKNLNDFIGTYDAMRENIDKMNAAFGEDLRGRLDDIFKQMSGQASKAADLSANVERLSAAADKYSQEVDKLSALFGKIGDRLSAINEIEKRAEAQISRLDEVMGEKSKNYNLTELQRALDSYNKDVNKVGEFINKDVAEALFDTRSKLESMKTGMDGVLRSRGDETATLGKLIETYSSSSELLKKIAEKQDVNEAYIFEIIDKWAGFEDGFLKMKVAQNIN